MTDTDQQTIKQAAESVAGLLVAHWTAIKDCADGDEKSMANINLSVKISFAGNVPRGVVNISFAARVKDSVAFSGEQLKLKGVEE